MTCAVSAGISPTGSGRRLRTISGDEMTLSGLRRRHRMFVSVGGRRMDLWRAVDGEREVLDVPVQATQWAAGFRLSFRFRP